MTDDYISQSNIFFFDFLCVYSIRFDSIRSFLANFDVLLI